MNALEVPAMSVIDWRAVYAPRGADPRGPAAAHRALRGTVRKYSQCAAGPVFVRQQRGWAGNIAFPRFN